MRTILFLPFDDIRLYNLHISLKPIQRQRRKIGLKDHVAGYRVTFINIKTASIPAYASEDEAVFLWEIGIWNPEKSHEGYLRDKYID